MKDFFECLTTTNGLAFGTGVLIFLFTFFLVVNRLIGFTLTLIFLIFALAASFGVANHESVKKYFDQISDASTDSSTENAKQEPRTTVRSNRKQTAIPRQNTSQEEDSTNKEEESINETLQRAYDELKRDYEILKKKLMDYINENQKGRSSDSKE